MKKIMSALLVLVLASLACSGSILKPTAKLGANVSTETPHSSPIPVPTMPELTETPLPITCLVTVAKSLHMRETPDNKGVVITWLYPGDQLILLPEPPAGAWVKVQFEDLTGWINSHYCER